MNEKLSTIEKIGGWISTLLLGKTKEIIIRTDERVQIISKIIDTEIKPDLKDVREKFFALEGKMSGAFRTKSPISLNSTGTRILGESGMKKLIDDNSDELMEVCKENRKMDTPYDVQRVVFQFFDEHRFTNEIENELKTYAFQQGISIDIVRRVGAIYFRDICLKQMKMDSRDLDKKSK